jgi:hypothetical protein
MLCQNINTKDRHQKIIYCSKSCTRQSIAEREGLEHDERSEDRVP